MGLVAAFYSLVILIFAVTVWGQSGAETRENPLLSQSEKEIRTRAKKRLYPGGTDEEPLRVQSQLALPVRRAQPGSADDATEPPDANADHD